jgi:hypothetical protein
MWATASDVLLRPIEVLVQPPPDDRQSSQCAVEQVAPPLFADGIADAVPDRRAEHGRDDHCPQRNPALIGEHPAEQDGDLPREHEANERGSLQGRDQEHDRERGEAMEPEDGVRDRSELRGHQLDCLVRPKSELSRM